VPGSEALGTGAPIDDLRLINVETGTGGGGQARGGTDGAVDVGRFSAGATDRMVVVVADAILVKGGRAGRLNAPDETLPGQNPKGVVNGLARDGTDLGAHGPGDGVRRAVGSARDRTQDGEALGRHGDAVAAKDVCGIRHSFRYSPFLD